jgi:hypothetical protein
VRSAQLCGRSSQTTHVLVVQPSAERLYLLLQFDNEVFLQFVVISGIARATNTLPDGWSAT